MAALEMSKAEKDLSSITTSFTSQLSPQKSTHRLSFSGFPSLDNILTIDHIDTSVSHLSQRNSEQWVMKVRGKYTPERKSRYESFGSRCNRNASIISSLASVTMNSKDHSSLTQYTLEETSTSFNSSDISEGSKKSSGPNVRTPLAIVTNMQQRAVNTQKTLHSQRNKITVKPRVIPLQLESTPEKSEVSQGHSVQVDSPNASTIVTIETPNLKEMNYEVLIGDKELVSFCGIVLRLLKRELEQAPDPKDMSKPLSTLPQLRKAFKDLMECTNVPAFLMEKAHEMKEQLEGKLRNKSRRNKMLCTETAEMLREDLISNWERRLSLDKKEITAQKEQEMKAELDKLSMKFQEEIARAEEQASLKAELEWKRKLSFGRKEAIAETTNKAAAEKAGIVNFAKQCVKAIAILKKKVEEEQKSQAEFEADKQKAVEEAANLARQEAEEVWSRRLSMAKRETEQKTKECLVEQFRQQHEEEIKAVTERIRSETEADWSVRLLEEQKNRRLSCQLKLTAAIERANKRYSKEKEVALAALAEELEKEKEEATKTAAENARRAVEHEWKRRYESELEEVKAKVLGAKKQVEPVIPVQSTSDQSTSEAKFGCVGNLKAERAQNPGESKAAQEERHVYGGRIRRLSTMETSQLNENPQRYSHGYRALSQDFSMMCGKPKRVSFVLGRESDRTVRDFSTEFALPSPIPIVSMPLDETAGAMTPMIPRAATHTAQKRTSRVYHGNKIKHRGNESVVSCPGADKGVLQFHIEELSVRVGELRSTMTSKYREYHINTLVTLCRNGVERQHSTSRTLRYSAARQIFHDDLAGIAKRIGAFAHFENLLTSFPPKAVTKSNSTKVAEYRANAIKNYIYSACAICARLMDCCSTEEKRVQLRGILILFFGDVF